MRLRLIREPTEAGATLGALYVDDRWTCWTLEDPIREVAGAPVSSWKVKGATAIPAGKYRIVVTYSPRFQRRLAVLVDVPGFEGIRIHAGNRPEDTEGCILVGFRRASAVILDSKIAVQQIQERIEAADGDVWITVENPPGWRKEP